MHALFEPRLNCKGGGTAGHRVKVVPTHHAQMETDALTLTQAERTDRRDPMFSCPRSTAVRRIREAAGCDQG